MAPPAIFPGLSRPLLFGHRGASLRAPENTFEAFELALCLGADVIELDVHATQDGQIVVIHDERVDRTTSGQGRVRDFTLAQLQELDAGYRFAKGPGDFPFRGKGVRIETLAATLQNFAKAAFNIDVKVPGIAAQVLRVLEEVGPMNVVLTATEDVVMGEIEAQKPGCALGMSKGQAFAALLGAYRGAIPQALHGRAMQIPPRYYGLPTVSDRLLRVTKAVGIELHLWTINDPRAARRWLARGVAGIMSDDPGSLAGAVIDAKQALERA